MPLVRLLIITDGLDQTYFLHVIEEGMCDRLLSLSHPLFSVRGLHKMLSGWPFFSPFFCVGVGGEITARWGLGYGFLLLGFLGGDAEKDSDSHV